MKKPLTLGQILFPTRKTKKIRFMWFAPNDHSMAPTIHPGDLLVGDLNEKRITSPGIYVVGGSKYEGVKFRRAEMLLNGGFRLCCDRGQYPPLNLTAREVAKFRVIARVVAHVRRIY